MLKTSLSSFNEKWENNGHYDKANDQDYIEVSANTNTLKSEMILKNNYEVTSENINPLMAPRISL